MHKVATISPLQYSRHVELYERLCGPFDHTYFNMKYGVTQERLNDPDYRVPLAAATDFFWRTAQELSDPCFGLTWAEKVRYGMSNPVVRKVAVAPDVRNYFTQNIRLSKLTSELATFSIEPYDQGCSLLRMEINEEEDVSYHQIDATMLYIKRATADILRLEPLP